MVEAGMDPTDAIRSATISAAKLLRMDEELGQIQPGFYADIVAVDQNPLDDIKRLQEISFVMKGGKIFKR